jgi:hypothetical protein
MNEDLQIRTSLVTMQRIMEHGIEYGAFEDKLSETHLTHYFTPISKEYGCAQYARELFMPAGTICVGKLHKLPHLTFLMKGRMIIISENGGHQELTGPTTFVSPAGSKRAFHVLEDSIITTVHVTKHSTEAEVPLIEDEVISPTYEAMGLEEPDTTGLENFLSDHSSTETEVE